MIETSRNYFTGKQADKEVYTEVARVIRLCISYNIMEPEEGYDENDPKRQTHFTKPFESFKRDFFIPLVMEDKELHRRSANSFEFFMMLITYYVSAERVSAIKFKDHPGGGFVDVTYGDIIEQSETLEDKTIEDIMSMTRLVAGLLTMSLDHDYRQHHKILERMINLEIIKRHGELTAEFKLYLEDYCKDQNIKSISDLGQPDSDIDTDSRDSSKMIVLIAMFIGMSTKEFKKIFKSKHRQNEAFDLQQMALVVKQCLNVKEA